MPASRARQQFCGLLSRLLLLHCRRSCRIHLLLPWLPALAPSHAAARRPPPPHTAALERGPQTPRPPCEPCPAPAPGAPPEVRTQREGPPQHPPPPARTPVPIAGRKSPGTQAESASPKGQDPRPPLPAPAPAALGGGAASHNHSYVAGRGAAPPGARPRANTTGLTLALTSLPPTPTQPPQKAIKEEPGPQASTRPQSESKLEVRACCGSPAGACCRRAPCLHAARRPARAAGGVRKTFHQPQTCSEGAWWPPLETH